MSRRCGERGSIKDWAFDDHPRKQTNTTTYETRPTQDNKSGQSRKSGNGLKPKKAQGGVIGGRHRPPDEEKGPWQEVRRTLTEDRVIKKALVSEDGLPAYRLI